MNNLKNRLHLLFLLPYSILFCFHYLPFKQAVRMPILFFVRPTFLKFGGRVILNIPDIRLGMIKLGVQIAPIERAKSFRWQNTGTIIFNGSCTMSHHTFISCAKGAQIEIGRNSSFSFGLRLIAANKITFADKVRISWSCGIR